MTRSSAALRPSTNMTTPKQKRSHHCSRCNYWWRGVIFARALFSSSCPGLPLLIGSGCYVVGPVASDVFDPSDGGVDVHAEKVGEDGCGQIGREGDEGAVAGDSNVDVVSV